MRPSCVSSRVAQEEHEMENSQFTRRQALARGAMFVGGAALLDACGSTKPSHSSPPKTLAELAPSSAGGGTPVRGGTFTVAMVSGGTNETLNPAMLTSYADNSRQFSLYDQLFVPYPRPGVSIEPRLALSAESNSSATSWVLHLRDGVTWHDGKPFSAD